jgi:hypothetical protein
MKWAPVCAAGAIAMLLLGVGLSERFIPTERKSPLDVRGVSVLQVVGPREQQVEIHVTSAPAGLVYEQGENVTVTARRQGRLLRVEGNIRGYDTLHVSVPPTVRTFVVGSATIDSKLSLDSPRVLFTRGLTWDASATRLDVRRVGIPAACGCNCSPTVTIKDASVGHLTVAGSHTVVALERPDRIDRADLAIAPGTVNLTSASRLDQIHLLAAPDEAAAAFSPSGKRCTAGDVASARFSP